MRLTLLIALLHVVGTQANQLPWRVPSVPVQQRPPVLGEDLRLSISRVLEQSNVTGYSLGLVRSCSAEAEYFVWGNRTEEGAAVTPDVSTELWVLVLLPPVQG
jgi:hypothetical protein